MKPLLYKFMGIWHCANVDCYRIGMGYTPELAYADWLKINQAIGSTGACKTLICAT